MSQKGVKGTEAHQAHLRELAHTFGQNLGVALGRRNLSLSEAGRRIGVSRQTVSNWTKGELPEWPSITALSLALDIPLAEVFEGRYNEHPNDERIAEKLAEQLRKNGQLKEITERLEPLKDLAAAINKFNRLLEKESQERAAGIPGKSRIRSPR